MTSNGDANVVLISRVEGNLVHFDFIYNFIHFPPFQKLFTNCRDIMLIRRRRILPADVSLPQTARRACPADSANSANTDGLRLHGSFGVIRTGDHIDRLDTLGQFYTGYGSFEGINRTGDGLLAVEGSPAVTPEAVNLFRWRIVETTVNNGKSYLKKEPSYFEPTLHP